VLFDCCEISQGQGKDSHDLRNVSASRKGRTEAEIEKEREEVEGL